MVNSNDKVSRNFHLEVMFVLAEPDGPVVGVATVVDPLEGVVALVGNVLQLLDLVLDLCVPEIKGAEITKHWAFFFTCHLLTYSPWLSWPSVVSVFPSRCPPCLCAGS